MRYIIFAFDRYYPLGGADDIQLLTDTEEEAYAKFVELREPAEGERRYGCVQAYDIMENRVVFAN